MEFELKTRKYKQQNRNCAQLFIEDMLEERGIKPARLTPENDLVNCGFSCTRISEEKQTCLRNFIFKTFVREFNSKARKGEESNKTE